MVKRAFAAVLVLGAVLSFGPAAAQSVQCTDTAALRSPSPQDVIASCSTLLMQGDATGARRAEIYFARGIAMGRVGDHQRAISDYNEALRSNPQEAEIYNNRGFSYQQIGRLPQARADYDRAIQLNPRLGQAWSNRGSMKLNAGDFRGAIADISQAIAITPVAIDHYNRGLAYVRQQDYRNGIPDFDSAARLEGGNAQYHNARCWYRAVANVELSAARSACDRAVNLSAGTEMHAAYLDSRGLVSLRQSRWRDAFNDYDAAVREREQANWLFGRGYAASRLRRAEQARADFARALELNPNIATTFAGYGFAAPPDLLPSVAPPPTPTAPPPQATVPPPPQTQTPVGQRQTPPPQTQTPVRQTPPPVVVTPPPVQQAQAQSPGPCDVAGIRVFFGAGQATLDPSARQLLEVLLPRIAACRGGQIVLRGNIDGAEAQAGAGDLGQRRAGAVRDYLAQRGVAASTIALQDLAFTAPMVGTGAGVSEPQNRNVEFAVMTATAAATPPRAPETVTAVQPPPRTQSPPPTVTATTPAATPGSYQPGGPGRHIFTYQCPDNSELRVTFDNDDQTAIVARIRRPPATLRAAPRSNGDFHYANDSYDLSGAVSAVIFRVGSGAPMTCPRRGR